MPNRIPAPQKQGRTTRALLAAIKIALAGKTVTFFCINAGNISYCQSLAMRVMTEATSPVHAVERYEVPRLGSGSLSTAKQKATGESNA